MRKIIVSLFLILTILNPTTALAHHCSSVHLVHKEVETEQIKFLDCNKHSMLKETTTYLYSNGQRRRIDNSTIFNQDGSILESDCSNVKHIIYQDKHFFTFYKNKKYNIINENGEYLTVKKYSSMKEIAPNRLLVKFNKKYGIINLQGEALTNTKYKAVEQISGNLYKTELNGFYGFINNSGKEIIKNEYDKITQLQNTFILKKEGNYGLCNKNGKIILNTEYDKIKEIDDYIVVKKDKLYAIYNNLGEQLTKFIYKDVKLDRNVLKVKTIDNQWIKHKTDSI